MDAIVVGRDGGEFTFPEDMPEGVRRKEVPY